MSVGLKRSTAQTLAQAKIDDAIILLKNGRFSNSYYLAGYSIELAIKACIAAQFTADTIPEKAFVKDIYEQGHNLPKLIKLAGLSSELAKQEDRDVNFGTNWGIVAQWSERSRYETQDSMSAQLLISAIMDPKSGVLEWIKKFW